MNPNDYLRRGEYLLRWRLLELMAYINTSGRTSRWARSERRDIDVHRAGVYWSMGVIKFAGGTIRLWGCGDYALTVRYGGIFWMFVRISYKAVRNQYTFVRSLYNFVRVRTSPYA